LRCFWQSFERAAFDLSQIWVIALTFFGRQNGRTSALLTTKVDVNPKTDSEGWSSSGSGGAAKFKSQEFSEEGTASEFSSQTETEPSWAFLRETKSSDSRVSI
jgi:hypothetical protein